MASKSVNSKKPKKPRSTLKWLCVLEVDDAVAPRRAPDKPNVRVEALAKKPWPDLDAWVAKSHKFKKRGVTRVLYSEMPDENHAGGLRRPYRSPEQASQIKSAIRNLRERVFLRVSSQAERDQTDAAFQIEGL